MFHSIAGNNVREKSDLQPALRALKDRLMTKDVTAMAEALLRILTPGQSIAILREIHATKECRKPYVIVFVGVNGIGRYTNIDKVVLHVLRIWNLEKATVQVRSRSR